MQLQRLEVKVMEKLITLLAMKTPMKTEGLLVKLEDALEVDAPMC